MTRSELRQKTDTAVIEIKTALQTVYDALNQGQRNKLLKDETVSALFERYGVEV